MCCLQDILRIKPANYSEALAAARAGLRVQVGSYIKMYCKKCMSSKKTQLWMLLVGQNNVAAKRAPCIAACTLGQLG
jgi:hypothetical protein